MTERTTVLLVWIGLVLVMAFVISTLIAFGLEGMILRAPPAGWSDVLLTNALFLFILGATDYPERIRKSSALKRQVLCWSVFMFAFSLLVRSSLRPTMEAY